MKRGRAAKAGAPGADARRSTGGEEARGSTGATGAELERLREDDARKLNWKRWGPYLAERQWGTVREDYSHDGSAWSYLPHDHARSRAYRWGEDGLLGICDRQGRLCFALALWNERDPFLKERLFGLAGPEGNHGEDVKEEYYYLDSTPTHSYLKALYRYPIAAFPYERLVVENRERGLEQGEFELADTGVLDENRCVDVLAEYAKASPNDVLIRITLHNRAGEPARMHALPTLWFRNTWGWGHRKEGYSDRPRIARAGEDRLLAEHRGLGRFQLAVAPASDGTRPRLVFTENETNSERLFGSPNASRFVKDAFHELVVGGREDVVDPAGSGTKSAAWFALEIPAEGNVTLHLRLSSDDEAPRAPFGREFEETFGRRIRESEAFWNARLDPRLTADERNVARQAHAGLLWSKQFYHYVVRDWVGGDPAQPAPPEARRSGRNHEWRHLYNRDVVSMPDKWEYPWYAAWDLAFHMLPFASIDPAFAKEQLTLFLREWYMHPNGQIPAYEWALGDVNPPVHAWACWRVYKMTGKRGERDRAFLASTFQKLLINFTWWVNRKDEQGRNLFSGGFLGLDNIGVFDRSKPLPTGGHIEQADGTAWMAFYCATMLSMALELARDDRAYEDMASKFFEHFVAIADAMNHLGGAGLWDEQDGFYYDQLHASGTQTPLRVRSLVGLVPLFAVEVLEDEDLERLPGFQKRMRWFLENRPDLASHISYMAEGSGAQRGLHLLAIPSRERLVRVLSTMLDESEFLSAHGIRSLSRVHAESPYSLHVDGEEHRVEYAPAESRTKLFGGNSNWRGPIWFPMNYLIVEALERYHRFYGDDLRVECPVGSGRRLTLAEVAREISSRLSSIFLRGPSGQRPCFGTDARFATDPHLRDLVLFHEYFHGDTGRGLGASHQTGWTALVVRFLQDRAQRRSA